MRLLALIGGALFAIAASAQMTGFYWEFDPPTDGGVVEYYECRANGEILPQVTEPRCYFESLTVDSTYMVDVRACNVFGCGEWGAAGNFTVSVPGRPSAGRLKRTDSTSTTSG